MKRIRLRHSSILWLVALTAAFLAGIRHGEYRAPCRGGVIRAMAISPPKSAELKVQVRRGK